MGRADRIEGQFPPGIKMPDELRRLCDFLDRTAYPISGCMKLRPEGEGLKGWFGADSEAWRQLAGFGAGPDGSTLALWLYAGTDISIAPVVHLGSEGDQLIVLTDNLREFLVLFGIGYRELGFDDLSKPPEEPESAARLRDWLATEFGIQCPETGYDLVRRAQSRHPDFAAWVHAAQELRDAAQCKASGERSVRGLLIDIIGRLDEVDDSDGFQSLCLYAEGGPDALPDSPALVCPDSDETGFECPQDAALSYVLMVQQAKECIEVWSEWRGGRRPSPQEKFAAVMFYSRNNAWLPLESP